MTVLTTIILGSNRPKNIKEFIHDLESKTTNPSSVEIIFSIDEGDNASIDALHEMQKISSFKIKYLESKRTLGYFEANIHYNKCLGLAGDTSYFFALFSDKVKIKEKGWDEVLKKYIHHFEDDYFRIRISDFKNTRNSVNLYSAVSKPENFAFHTRKFLELTGGWGNIWGPDSWAQALVFFNELLGIDDRDIVESNINLLKYDYTTPPDKKNYELRRIMIDWSFNFVSYSRVAIMNHYRIALKTVLYLRNKQSLLAKNSKFNFSYTKDSVILRDDAGMIIDRIRYSDIANYGCNNFIRKNLLMEKDTKRVWLYSKISRKLQKIKKKNFLKKILAYVTVVKDFVQIYYITIQEVVVGAYNINIPLLNNEEILIEKAGSFNIETNKQIEMLLREKYHQTLNMVEKYNS